ncbi:MAG: 30S ribosomal protein S2, partial [Bdellovibrionales bacterium]|nr:30S ribosomal protein S2 [Bdellovibrionales bacterium]
DTNSDPETIEFPIPGNDDAIRSIKLFCNLVADAYAEGAKEWEQKLRTQTDKASDVAAEEKAAKEKPEAKAAEGGPAVVKATKGRKLVAAGTADEIEILAEVEQESQKKDEEVTPETETKE